MERQSKTYNNFTIPMKQFSFQTNIDEYHDQLDTMNKGHDELGVQGCMGSLDEGRRSCGTGKLPGIHGFMAVFNQDGDALDDDKMNGFGYVPSKMQKDDPILFV